MWNEFCKIKTSAECSLHNTAIISLKWGPSHYQFDDWCEWSYLILVNWKEASDTFSLLASVSKAGLCLPSCQSCQGQSPHSFAISWIKDLLYRVQKLLQDCQREAFQTPSSKGSQTSFPWSFRASRWRKRGDVFQPRERLHDRRPPPQCSQSQPCLPGAPCQRGSRAGCWPGRTVQARWRRALRKGWFRL